jgi:hypothetical protein
MLPRAFLGLFLLLAALPQWCKLSIDVRLSPIRAKDRGASANLTPNAPEKYSQERESAFTHSLRDLLEAVDDLFI